MAKTITKLDDWMQNTKSKQENLSSFLNGSIWDQYNFSEGEKKLLFKKIALYLFGFPENEADYEKDDYGLPDDKKTLTNRILKKCIYHSYDKGQIRIGIIFIFVYLHEDAQTVVPLIRVMSNSDQKDKQSIQSNVYIDHLSRVYKNFDDYKENNTWDLCWLGLPESGYYTSDLRISFLDQSSRGVFLQKLDKYSNITNIASTISMAIGGGMALFPPTAPIGAGILAASAAVGTPSAVYGVGRSIKTISDRIKHEQTINIFKDAEARQCWLTVAVGIVSVGAFSSAQILARSARAGRTLSATALNLCTGISATSLSLSGISILNSLYELKKKGIDNITKFDVLQFTTSIFFFAHSVVSFKTASAIIKDVQAKEIESIKTNNVSPEHHEKYDNYVKGKKESLGQGNKKEVIEVQAEFIREMKTYDNVNDFFKQFKIDKKGQVHVNKKLTINPQDIAQLNKFQKKKFFKFSKQLEENKISVKKFNQYAKRITKRHNIIVDQVQNQKFLKEVYNVENVKDIKVGCQKLGEAKPNEINRLKHVVKNSLNNGDKDYIAVTNKLADKLEVKSFQDYCAVRDYISRKMKLEIKNRSRKNPNPKGPGVKAREFYKTQVANEILKNIDNYIKDFRNVNKERNDIRISNNHKLLNNNTEFKKINFQKNNALSKKSCNNVKTDSQKANKHKNSSNVNTGGSMLKNSKPHDSYLYNGIMKEIAEEFKIQISDIIKRKLLETVMGIIYDINERYNSEKQQRTDEKNKMPGSSKPEGENAEKYSSLKFLEDGDLEIFERFRELVMKLAEDKSFSKETINDLFFKLVQQLIRNKYVPWMKEGGHLEEKEVVKKVYQEILENDQLLKLISSFNNEFLLMDNDRNSHSTMCEEKVMNDSNEYFQNTFYQGYFEIAQDIVHTHFFNFNLSINGKEIIGTLISEVHGPMAIKYDMNPDKESGTATLYKLAGLEPVIFKTMLFRSDEL